MEKTTRPGGNESTLVSFFPLSPGYTRAREPNPHSKYLRKDQAGNAPEPPSPSRGKCAEALTAGSTQRCE